MNYGSIDSVLLRKPHLELVSDDLYRISGRIKEIEDGYFIVRNKRNGKYEVHSSQNKGWNTYCFTVPFEELDARTLYYCLETNLAIHGDAIEKKIESENSRKDVDNEKNLRRTLTEAGEETAERVALGIEKDELHDGYTKTHMVGGLKKNES